MPAGFRRHFVGKTLINVFLLSYRLNTLCWPVNDHRDIVLDHLIQFHLKNAINLRPSTPYIAILYPQNGDSLVTIDSVTSLHPMCSKKAKDETVVSDVRS